MVLRPGHPNLGRCLERGVDFIWYIRPLYRSTDGEVVAGEWSDGLVFAVPKAPSTAEVEGALRVLRSYSERHVMQPEGEQGFAGLDNVQPSNIQRASSTGALKRSVEDALAAIKGEIPDPTGETYGVVGLSSSPEGAGLAAGNTAGGPDLVLDGTLSGAADTLLSEWGIDRPSLDPQLFSIGNSLGGGITFDVDGVEVVTTDTDADSLADLSCTSGELAEWDGALWTCGSDDDTTYQPGNRLTLDGNTFNVTEGSGSGLDADQIDGLDSTAFAPAAHLHDDRYYTENELGTSGSSSVHWDNLNDVPTGFADGVDDDTSYSSGVGVDIVGERVDVMLADRTPKPNSGNELFAIGGYYTSIAVGSNGLPVVFGSDPPGGYAGFWCNDIECSTVGTSSPFSDIHLFSDTAVGSDGMPITVWIGNYPDYKLWVRRWNSPQYEIAPGYSNASVAVGADGLPIICFGNGPYLRLAHCDTPSIVLRSATSPYGSVSQAATLVARLPLGRTHCRSSLLRRRQGIYWGSPTAMMPPARVPLFVPSCRLGTSDLCRRSPLGADGLPLLAAAHLDSMTIKGVHCDSVTCASHTTSTIDAAGVAGPITTPHAIDIGFDGLPVLVYERHSSAGGGVRYARCRDFACNSASYRTIIQNARYPSVAIGADGRPIIAYQSLVSGASLRVLHCSNEHCVSYFRPR